MTANPSTRVRRQFANSLVYLTRKHGLTLKELSSELNFSYSCVSRWTRGETFPTPEALETLQDFFNVPISTLFGETTTLESGLIKIIGQIDLENKVKVLDYALQLLPQRSPVFDEPTRPKGI